jgi:hypothetical protein
VTGNQPVPHDFTRDTHAPGLVCFVSQVRIRCGETHLNVVYGCTTPPSPVIFHLPAIKYRPLFMITTEPVCEHIPEESPGSQTHSSDHSIQLLQYLDRTFPLAAYQLSRYGSPTNGTKVGRLLPVSLATHMHPPVLLILES